MSDSLAPLKKVAARANLFSTLLGSLVAIATALGVCVAFAQGFTTDVELRDAFADLAKAREREAQAIETERKREAEKQAERDDALMYRLVGLEAADLEPDKKRKAAAASHARAAFTDARARNVSLAIAAQRALDDLPPWRR